MWTKSHSITTKEVTKEQIWKLFADVNNWHTWDKGLEFAKMEGEFKDGNCITLRPKGGPTLKNYLKEVVVNEKFTDVTKFPLAIMYYSHKFEDTTEGLKITITLSMKGVLAFLWVKIVAQNIIDSLPVEMEEQIKAASKL